MLALRGSSAGSSALKPLNCEEPCPAASCWVGSGSIVGRVGCGPGSISFFFALRLWSITAIAIRHPMTMAPKALPIPIPAFSPTESPSTGGAAVDEVGVGRVVDSAGWSLLLMVEITVDCVSWRDVVDGSSVETAVSVGACLGNQDIVPPRLSGRLAIFSSIGLSWKSMVSREHLQFEVGGLDPTRPSFSGHPAHEV